jgi:very-short-patch-repair endonuclease
LIDVMGHVGMSGVWIYLTAPAFARNRSLDSLDGPLLRKACLLTGWVGISDAARDLAVVGTHPRIPLELKLGPFSLAEAQAAGISRTALQGRAWRRVTRGIYCWAGLLEDPLKFLFAYQRLVPESVFGGASAAWLHGIDVDPIRPIEIIVPPRFAIRTRPGLTVRHVDLSPDQMTRARGLRATVVHRTLTDLSRQLRGVDALVVIDQAVRLRLVDCAGARRLHPIGALAEPAESPMETRLRWLLLQAGLGRPQVQAPIPEAHARADLYFPDARLVVEFDGGNHRVRMVEDNRRQNVLINAGYKVLRFTASDVYNRPQTIVRQVSAAVGACARPPAAGPR